MSTGVSSNTNVHKGDHPLVRSAVVFRETLRLTTMFNLLTRDAKNLATTKPDKRMESDKQAPIVVVNDLQKGVGSEVQVTLHHDVGGSPIMGTKNAEGKGEERTKSHDSVKIDRTTKPVKDGDQYEVQERGYKMKDFNKSELGKYFRKLQDQRLVFHLAGSRGHYMAKDMYVPLEDKSNYKEVMINPVTAPSASDSGDGGSSRHFFVGEKNCISGADKPLTATDTLTLDDIRHGRVRIEEMPNPPELIDLSPADDPYRYDPLLVLFISPRAWEDLSKAQDTKQFEVLRSNAIARASIIAGGKKGVHPIFRGDCLLVDDVLVRKLPYPIRFLPGQKTLVDDFSEKRYSPEEQMVPLPAQGADGYCVERGLWVGGQALMMAFGNVMSGAKSGKGSDYRNFNFLDSPYDFKRKSETAIEWVDGCKKISFTDSDGVDVDRGVIAMDYATRLKL